jgi:hypothetical protein
MFLREYRGEAMLIETAGSCASLDFLSEHPRTHTGKDWLPQTDDAGAFKV